LLQWVRRQTGPILLVLLAGASVTYSACSSTDRSFVDDDGGGGVEDSNSGGDVLGGDSNHDTSHDTHDTEDDVPSSGG
jgi:hypothetical protein